MILGSNASIGYLLEKTSFYCGDFLIKKNGVDAIQRRGIYLLLNVQMTRQTYIEIKVISAVI